MCKFSTNSQQNPSKSHCQIIIKLWYLSPLSKVVITKTCLYHYPLSKCYPHSRAYIVLFYHLLFFWKLYRNTGPGKKLRSSLTGVSLGNAWAFPCLDFWAVRRKPWITLTEAEFWKLLRSSWSVWNEEGPLSCDTVLSLNIFECLDIPPVHPLISPFTSTSWLF